MGRVVPVDEKPRIRYLRPGDGKVADLTVQCAKWPYYAAKTDRWDHLQLKNKTPWVIRLVYYTVSSVPTLATGESTEEQAESPSEKTGKQGEMTDWKKVRRWISEHSTKNWWLLYVKWIPSCIIILILVCIARCFDAESC